MGGARLVAPVGLARALALVALGTLILPAALTARPARAETAGESARTVLHEDRYRFCHEDDYPLTPEEHAWCPLVGETSGVCPSLPKACLLPPVEVRHAPGSGHAGRVEPTKGDEAPTERPPQPDERQRPAATLSLPDLSGFARVLFVALLVLFVVAVARAILGNLSRSRADAGPTPPDGEAPPPKAPPGEPAARGPVETDVQRLLARARAAAGRGDYRRAVDDAYAALLRRLDGDGLIEIHPSRTNGDYVRALGGRPDLKGAVRDIARDVEGVQFGEAAPSESVFRSVLERVLPLVSRALVLGLVLSGLSVALSCSPHQGGDEDQGDASPSGTQAVVEVLSKHGFAVRRRTEPLSKLEHPISLVVLPEVTLDPEAWTQLFVWMKDQGGTLMLAGAKGAPEEFGIRAVPDAETATEVSPTWAPRVRAAIPPGLRLVDWQGDGPPDGLRLHRGAPHDDAEQSVAAMYHRVGKGKLIVFADGRYLSNVSLAVADNAELLVDLLHLPPAGDPSHEVEICDRFTGMGAHTPLESVSRAELTPVVVQLLVLLALLFLWKGRAFARLRDPPAAGRRAFADHARALGLAYGRARASRHAAGLYATWALDRLRERVQRGGRPGLIPLAEAIAVRTGRTEADVMRVLMDASGARDDTAPPSSFRPAPRRAFGGGPPGRPERKADRDPVAADLALMDELSTFLAATGQRRSPAEKGPPAP